MVEENDWVALHRYYSDAECMKYTLGRVLTEGDSWRTIAAIVGHWYFRGYGPYSLVDKKQGHVVGLCGLWYPNDWPEPEIKWGLIREYWGMGYAKEAAIAVKNMAKSCLPDLSLISLIFSGNHNSIQLAKALNARFESEIEFRNSSAQIYRHVID